MSFKPNQIGLDHETAEAIATQLTELLAEYNVLYSNLRAFHWNVRGPMFIPLHDLFEEIYTKLNEQIDDVAERIATLGYVPLHTMSAYLATATLKEAPYTTKPDKCIQSAIQGFYHILNLERDTVLLASELSDEGTLTMISDNITKHEKDVWLLSSSLSGQ